jgi:hypothetical protein
VIQRAGHPRLADEALGHRGIAHADPRQLLDRDLARQHGLEGEIHHGHAAAPEHLDDPVRTDLLRDIRHHGPPCHIVSIRRPGARGLLQAPNCALLR